MLEQAPALRKVQLAKSSSGVASRKTKKSAVRYALASFMPVTRVAGMHEESTPHLADFQNREKLWREALGHSQSSSPFD